MRAAVISDVHANLHALESVLEDVDAEGVDAVWFLGDLVGYGPRPNECCALLRDRVDVALVGNHDLVALGVIGTEEFNHEARRAAEWTREQLDKDTRAFLDDRSSSAAVEQAQLFHASARDPVWEYVLTLEAATATLALTSAGVVLVGHSHVALDLALAEEGFAEGGVAPAGTRVVLDERRRLFNPGSVGQPRDGDPRAAWLLLDFAARFASFHRVAYQIERTQGEMRDAGLPEPLAARLAVGQ